MTIETTTPEKDGSSSEPVDLQGLDLNFVPEWARKPGGQNDYFNNEPREDRRDRRPRGRSYGPGRGGRGQDRRRPADGERRGDKRPDRPRPDSRPPRGDRPPRDRSARPRVVERRPREQEPIPPVNVRFLPVTEAISEIARKIKANRRAHPMMQVASLYLANPETIVALVEVDKGDRDMSLLQCTKCGMIAIKQDTMSRHLCSTHMDDYVERIEEEVEPPKGSFSSVAQCGLSGTLLGPSNHHSYLVKLKETHSRLYPNMSLESYTSRIKTLHDKEAIEKWKAECSKRTVYKLKSAEDAEPMTEAQAKALFLEKIASGLVREKRRAQLPIPLCRSIEDMGLQLAIKNEWIKENRFPISIMMALRGAFTSKGFHVFRAGKGKGVTFVTPIAISPIKVDHVTDEIKEVLQHLNEHPGSNRGDLLAALRPNAAPDSEEAGSMLAPLGWMIERGHIIEFFDGTLSFPS